MGGLAVLIVLIAFLASCAPKIPDVPAGATGGLPATSIKTEEQSRAAPSSFEVVVPQWKPGDEWTFRQESPQGKGTFVWAVNREESVDGVAYYVVTIGRQREFYQRKADLALYMDKIQGAIEQRWVPPQLLYVWPLVPGKRWVQTYTSENPRDRQTTDITSVCQVEAMETITVPAGSFMTLKIVCHNQRTDALMYERWYAPAVKHWIRERSRFPYGIRERELINFKVD